MAKQRNYSNSGRSVFAENLESSFELYDVVTDIQYIEQNGSQAEGISTKTALKIANASLEEELEIAKTYNDFIPDC